jgi:hypothetical protein
MRRAIGGACGATEGCPSAIMGGMCYVCSAAQGGLFWAVCGATGGRLSVIMCGLPDTVMFALQHKEGCLGCLLGCCVCPRARGGVRGFEGV